MKLRFESHKRQNKLNHKAQKMKKNNKLNQKKMKENLKNEKVLHKIMMMRTAMKNKQKDNI